MQIQNCKDTLCFFKETSLPIAVSCACSRRSLKGFNVREKTDAIEPEPWRGSTFTRWKEEWHVLNYRAGKHSTTWMVVILICYPTPPVAPVAMHIQALQACCQLHRNWVLAEWNQFAIGLLFCNHHLHMVKVKRPSQKEGLFTRL